jgi:hypothetical protein
VRRIPVLDRAIASVLTYADEGDDRLVLLTTLANGAAEEVFFRGALYAAIGQEHPVALSTGAYALATIPTRNPALVLAATVMGHAVRRAAAGVRGHPGAGADPPDLVDAHAALPAAAVQRAARDDRSRG